MHNGTYHLNLNQMSPEELNYVFCGIKWDISYSVTYQRANVCAINVYKCAQLLLQSLSVLLYIIGS